jgi:hypothetical protein
MTRSIARSTVVLFALFLAACGGSSGGGGSTGSGSDGGAPADGGGGGGGGGYATISLSQTDVHIPRFMMTAFAVTAVREDGSRIDVTEQATARSSDQKVATVDHGQGAQMLIHSQDEGTAIITVTVGALTQDVKVTVTAN